MTSSVSSSSVYVSSETSSVEPVKSKAKKAKGRKWDHKPKKFRNPPGHSYPAFYNNDGTIWKCSQCMSTNTPMRRKGAEGANSLCNACGLYYPKLLAGTVQPIELTDEELEKFARALYGIAGKGNLSYVLD